MQRDCAFRIAGRGRLTSFSVEYKTGNQSLFEYAESFTKEELRRLAEGHLGSRRPLHVLPLTPTHRRLRLEWCHTRENWTATEWNQVVFSDESRFNLSSDDNRVRVWRPHGERLNPTFASQRHTAPTAAQWYVHDILQPHVLSLMQQLPENAQPHTARLSQDCLRTVTTLLWPARSPDLSPIERI
ncbi:transposable element Tcb2 transposase [Trichonephila clavipes]|nr:transposable element Tcb2 transposase [Trichonephila clavipes]